MRARARMRAYLISTSKRFQNLYGVKKFLFFNFSYILIFIFLYPRRGFIMINFRFHRDTLEDSLSTVVSFNSLFDLFNYLSHHEVFESFAPELTNIKQRINAISIKYYKYYSFDSRVCDYLFAVFINDHIVGFCY